MSKQTSPMRFPRDPEVFTDLEGFAEKYLLFRGLPKEPFLGMDDPVVSVGSCFAENVAEYLTESGFRSVSHISLAESSNNVLSVRTMIDILLSESPAEEALTWAREFVRRDDLKDVHAELARAKLLIITLGVAVATTDEEGRPTSIKVSNVELISPNRHVLVLREIIDRLREFNPDCSVVLTVSPAPLVASPFPKYDAFTLDCVSKSIIRAAVAMYMHEPQPDVFYWPSYEAMRWFYGHSDKKYGDEDGVTRHVNASDVAVMMRLFAKYYATTQ